MSAIQGEVTVPDQFRTMAGMGWRPCPADLIAVLRELRPKMDLSSVTVRPFDGGLMCKVYHVKNASEELVLRFLPKGRPVERNQLEAMVTEWAGKKEVGAPFLASRGDGSAMLLGFVPGGTLDRDVSYDLPYVAKCFRKLHALPIPEHLELLYSDATQSTTFERLERQYCQAYTNNTPLPEVLTDALRMAKGIREKLEKEHPKRVICHIDGHRANMVRDPDDIRLIDWTLAGPDDPFMDLATSAKSFDLTLEQEKKFLAMYLEHDPSDAEWNHYLMVRPIPYLARAVFGIWFLSREKLSDNTAKLYDAQMKAFWEKKTLPEYSYFTELSATGQLKLETAEERMQFALSALKVFYEKVKEA